MIKSGMNAIAAMRNEHNVLVFIPEKIKINGQLYVSPFRLNHNFVYQENILSYSFDETMQLKLLFNNQSITITEPFTSHILQQLLLYAAKNRTAPKSKRNDPLKMSSNQYQQFIEKNQP
jgi:hypothetical protein